VSMFAGATQYPWPSLTNLCWFQVVTAANPIAYVSEGMRAALVPGIPPIPGWACVGALIGSLVLFGIIGLQGVPSPSHRLADSSCPDIERYRGYRGLVSYDMFSYLGWDALLGRCLIRSPMNTEP
jgi:hypothetical protein